MRRSEVSTSVVKWSSWMRYSEGLSNRVSNIITRYKDHMKFAAFMAFCLSLLIYAFVYVFIVLHIIVFSACFSCSVCF
jgi:hypothetical protein